MGEKNDQAREILHLIEAGSKIKNENNTSGYRNLYWDFNGYHSINRTIFLDDDETKEEQAKEDYKQNKKKLEEYKVMCNIIPAPFFHIFYSRKSDNTYFLTELSTAYEEVNDYENASQALSIQHGITHDQTNEIIELQNKISKKEKDPILSLGSVINEINKTYSEQQNIIDDDDLLKNTELKTTNDSITVKIVRDKIRIVERTLKSIVRNEFKNKMNELQENFPECYNTAEKNRKKEMIIDSVQKDTVGHMTLGNIVTIITARGLFPKWNYNYNSFLHNIREFRNNIDHYDGDNEERDFKNQDKIMIDIFCDKIITYTSNLELK